MESRIIALLTDFGLDDPYVGIMKGIISDLNPGSTLIDLSHQIPAGDIQRGAFVLWQAARDFPKGTIFLAVVDPGVGSKRKGVLLDRGDQIFIGPDNGLFSYLLYNSNFSCWELSNPDYQMNKRSTTFHGRDIFAPAAAFAAKQVPGSRFGSQITDLIEIPRPIQTITESSLTGEILSSDHFGNLFTSLGIFNYADDCLHYRSWTEDIEIRIKNLSQIQIQINGEQLPLVQTFSSTPPRTPAGLIGSTGLLEIIANLSSAESVLGIKNGHPVKLTWD